MDIIRWLIEAIRTKGANVTFDDILDQGIAILMLIRDSRRQPVMESAAVESVEFKVPAKLPSEKTLVTKLEAAVAEHEKADSNESVVMGATSEAAAITPGMALLIFQGFLKLIELWRNRKKK